MVGLASEEGALFSAVRTCSAVRKLGLDDEAILEIMAVVDLLSSLNRLLEGLQIEPDEKPWYG